MEQSLDQGHEADEIYQMDIRLGIGSYYSQVSRFGSTNHRSLKPCCAKRDSPPPSPEQNGGDRGDKYSTDWDKAWTNFKKQGRKTFFSQFSPNKYVSWNPKRSEFPLSEEVDPIKRTERSNLTLWTSPRFTLAGAIIIVIVLILYTILAPVK